MYDFSEDTSVFFSNVFSSLADTDKLIVFGSTATPALSNLHSFIAGFDYSGLNLWKHKLYFPGLYNTSAGYDVLIKQGKNYLIGGSILDTAANSRTIVQYPYLYRINATGDSVFYQGYPDTILSSGYNSIVTDLQGQVITAGFITGNTLTFSNWDKHYYYDSFSVWLAKYDSLGRLLWQKRFFTLNEPNHVNKIIISNDQQHYYLGGALPNPNYSGGYFYPQITKTDTSGNKLWTKFLPCGYSAFIYDVDLVADKSGGCYFAATYSDYPYDAQGGKQYYHIVYGQINESGDTVWTKKFNRNKDWSTTGNRIALATDGYLIISGITSGDGTATQAYPRPVLIKVDTLGNLIWYREKERIHHFQPTQTLATLSISPDNKILQGGYIETNYPLAGIYDTLGTLSWIVVSDTAGLSCEADTFLDVPEYPTSIPITINRRLPFTVFPNPVTDELQISYTGLADEHATMLLTDMAGRLLKIYHLKGIQGKETINIESLTPGMYLYRITSDNYPMIQGKLIKE